MNSELKVMLLYGNATSASIKCAKKANSYQYLTRGDCPKNAFCETTIVNPTGGVQPTLGP